jgi:two-component system, NtrC family, response regulator AtoC
MTTVIKKVLVVDDEEDFTHVLSRYLEKSGMECKTASSGIEALEILETEGFDLILSDILMPGMSGLDMLEELQSRNVTSPVIVMSAYGSLDTAVEAIKKGAYDYVSKPFRTMEEVLLTIRKLEEREALKRKVVHLEKKLQKEEGFGEIIGTSASMREVYSLVQKVAQFKTTVLIVGESGTGKELVAQAIHDQSSRKSEPFVAINCAAIPATLLESELFGHVKGAFTDAYADRTGIFEEADGGTILLDEMGEFPLPLQVKLLRTLQEGEIRRVGSTRSVKVDVRVLAATARDLESEVAAGQFREDLFYRLNVVQIRLPPLRERLADIEPLVRHFIAKTNERLGTKIQGIGKDALNALMAYGWPGNVRELENAIERASVLAEGDIMEKENLTEQMAAAKKKDWADSVTDLSIKKAMRELEERHIRAALIKTAGNRTHAAQLLEISHRALLYKIRDYDIDIPHT